MSFFSYPGLSINAAAVLHFIQSTERQPTYEQIKNQFVMDDDDIAYALAEIYCCGFFQIDENMTMTKWRLIEGSADES